MEAGRWPALTAAPPDGVRWQVADPQQSAVL